ncbi:pseudouridine synthase [Leptospira sp. WS92.C1]
MKSNDSKIESEILQVVVPKEESVVRLDHFLSKKFTYHSRTVWQKEIEAGRVVVSGKKVKSGIILREGDLVVYKPENKAEPPVKTDYKILMEDDWILVVNKPGDLPVHPAGVYRKGNLLTLLNQSGDFPELFTVHRLDRETSGVVLFAKSGEVASRMSRLFSSGKIQKYYITKVYGRFPNRMTAYGVLKSDSDSKIRKKRKFVLNNDRRFQKHGLDFAFGESNSFLSKKDRILQFDNSPPKEEICLTYFRNIRSGITKDVSDSNSNSYVLCMPVTGRMHQIRATLYSLGYPLLGDKLYGKEEEVFLEFIEGKNPDLSQRLGMARQALHAYAIRFIHPITKSRIKVIAGVPEDFL